MRRSLSVFVLLLMCVITSRLSAEQPLAVPKPWVVAHRGLLKHAPENTLANFRACLELRIGFEVDVRRSQDGQLVCIHDDTVDRTTNGRGAVNALTVDELRRLDAGGWFGPAFRGETIPTPGEIFELIGQHVAARAAACSHGRDR